MIRKSHIITLNIFVIIILILYYLIFENFDRFAVNKSRRIKPDYYNSNKLINSLPSIISGNISNGKNKANYKNLLNVQKIDEYLLSMSIMGNRGKDSKLIYPNAVLGMTNMIINKMQCNENFGKDLLLLVLVFNRVEDFGKRKLIRETWGQDFKNDSRSEIYFTVGLSKNSKVQKRLIEENKIYDDILQFGYYENYYNCTIKAIGLLRWTAMSCPFVKFMLKVDDDSLIFSDNLLSFCNSTNDDSLYGILWKNPPAIRGYSKWAISFKDYFGKVYPDSIVGPYLIPGSKVLSLYETAITESLPAHPFEDVYITGIVANKLNIPRKKLSSFVLVQKRSKKFEYCLYKNKTVFWQGFSNNRDAWKIYHKRDNCDILKT